ncbi:MmgE/PrpD family protein [Paramixta manurensis]|uniref:MmgE/PrpD family protein n=1 Tax=Paramixta manurensis TaxID=2740817 RepID=A0A6M8UQA8_9GAMM|nr:MmgE/PrpD family protein [Erwiniaceae bacterium PD-1]
MSSRFSDSRSMATQIAAWIVDQNTSAYPASTIASARRLLLDVVGLCIAARHQPYIQATVQSLDGVGKCTILGREGGFTLYDAALVNGTAAHGEDYDDTFEGGPVHSGAVVVPAVLAICEHEALSGEALLRGIAVGAEILCRLSLVAPRAIHRAGFHPTAVIGAIAAAGAVAAALGLNLSQTTSALGIAGSMASGIIEYLAEGTSTKRMHAGWAAQSGIRAALMARGGFDGPRTVLEGRHGFFKAFAPSLEPDFSPVSNGLPGDNWLMSDIAFKPYACGTMTQPYIDCAIALAAKDIDPQQIREIVCKVGEGTVHRLWEELAVKHRPPTAYAAKFSTPFCMAVGFFDGKAGLAQFTAERIQDPQLLSLAAKIRYEIDPANPYPTRFTGHLRAVMQDGTVYEEEQPWMRGGVQAPLTADELTTKFRDNARYGGWNDGVTAQGLALCESLFESTGMTQLHTLRQ